MTATERQRVRQLVAVLRGLYGDLTEELDDPDACATLWSQIEEQQLHLAELVAAHSMA